MTVVAEFDVRVAVGCWQLYADPRQLEAVVDAGGVPALRSPDHDLSVGGYVRAQVIARLGEKVHAYWRITAVDAPAEHGRGRTASSTIAGEPDPTMPLTTMLLTLDRPCR